MPHKFLLITLILALLAGCRPASADLHSPADPPQIRSATPASWPTGGWQSATPESQGLASGALAEMLEITRQPGYDLDSLLIVRHGKLVLAVHYPGVQAKAPHPVYSVTKSVIGLLVGIALEQGLLEGVEQPIWDFFSQDEIENWDPRKADLTIAHLLTMTTGLDWDESLIQRLAASADWADFMLELPMASGPGEAFNYCSGCTHLLSVILEQATGETAAEYARQHLFSPLGIDFPTWQSDRLGHSIGGWGLTLTPGDMAKLGLLVLQTGAWEGQQVIPASWVQQACQPRLNPPGERGEAYGYLWWQHPLPDQPPVCYAAGLHGQLIYVLPGQDMVVVTTAEMQEARPALLELLLEHILPAVQADEPLPPNAAQQARLEQVIASLATPR